MGLTLTVVPIKDGFTPVVEIGGAEIWRGRTAFPNRGEARAAGRSKIQSVLRELFEGAS